MFLYFVDRASLYDSW